MIYFSRLHFIQNARNAQALEFDATSNPRCKNHTGCRPAKRRPHCTIRHPCRCHGNYPCHTSSHPFCRWASAFANIDRDPTAPAYVAPCRHCGPREPLPRAISHVSTCLCIAEALTPWATRTRSNTLSGLSSPRTTHSNTDTRT